MPLFNLLHNFLPKSLRFIIRHTMVIENIKKARKYFKEKEVSLVSIKKDFYLLTEMLQMILKKKYPPLPFKSLIWAAFALLYFISPLDLIPDFIPGLGLLDDVLVLSNLLSSLKEDLKRFESWKKSAEGKAAQHILEKQDYEVIA